MDRLQEYLNQLILRHETLVKSKADWAKESYCLGQISAVRTAITLIREQDSTIPAHLIV